MYLSKLEDRCKEINCRLEKPFVYVNNKSRVFLICNIDNFKWSTSYTKFVNKTGCPKCNGQVPPTQEEITENINRICSERNYILLEPFIYKNHNSKIHLKCNIDNHTWYVNYYCLTKLNYSCSKCKRNKKLTQEEAEFIVNKYCIINNYTLLEPFEYTNTHDTRLLFKCNIDNYNFLLTFNKLKYTKCPKCSNLPNINQKEAEYIVSLRCEKINCRLEKAFEYTNNKTRLYLICNIDNHCWSTTYANFINNKTACSKCNNSKLEKEIEYHLRLNNINYTYQYRSKKLGRLSLDFYLCDYNIAIECQGIQHFKTVEYFKSNIEQIKNCDKRKYDICDMNNIKILYFAKELYSDYFAKIYTDVNEIIEYINEFKKRKCN